MKVGDTVKVKSREEILKTLDKDYRCIHPNKDESHHINFNDLMFNYTGLIGTISKIDDTTGNVQIKFTNQTASWWWHPSWLELIPEELDYLNDGSIEQRSLCLALIRQVMSGNELDVEYLRSYNNSAFPPKEHNGFYYNDYPQDEWVFNTRIAKNIPDWPCLNLKPEILEEAIKNCLTQYDLQHFKKHIGRNISAWFVFSNTKKRDFWNKVARILDTAHLELVKDTNIKQPYKTKENENKLQRKKSIVIRGTVPEGSIACGRKRKTSIAVGYLSNSVCIGG